MAFKEVTIDESDLGGGGEFFSFKAIGDKLEGYFVSAKKSTQGQYLKPDDVDYSFLCKGDDGKPAVKKLAPPPTNAKQKLAKLVKSGVLVQGVTVRMQYTADQPTGQASPMKVIKVQADVDDAGKPIVKPAVLEAIKKFASAPPPAKPKDEADLFGTDGGDDVPF